MRAPEPAVDAEEDRVRCAELGASDATLGAGRGLGASEVTLGALDAALGAGRGLRSGDSSLSKALLETWPGVLERGSRGDRGARSLSPVLTLLPSSLSLYMVNC